LAPNICCWVCCGKENQMYRKRLRQWGSICTRLGIGSGKHRIFQFSIASRTTKKLLLDRIASRTIKKPPLDRCDHSRLSCSGRSFVFALPDHQVGKLLIAAPRSSVFHSLSSARVSDSNGYPLWQRISALSAPIRGRAAR
jgi:hypothetical protein